MDLRPVGYVIGCFLLALAALMIPPAGFDALSGYADWRAFVVGAVLTGLVGGALTLGCLKRRSAELNLEQALLLVVGAWVALPAFGALPLMIGDVQASPIDALFEAVSGITTTGSTVIENLDRAPPGLLLWRALLQWIGGVGVAIFAVAFLPALRIGGMQLFRTEGIDSDTASVGRATDIGAIVFVAYIALTALCAVAYRASGMSPFDALCHAMTTIATGGFANYDASFRVFTPAAQYVAVVFMLLASLPFLIYRDIVARRDVYRLVGDPQVRGFLLIALAVWFLIVLGRQDDGAGLTEKAVRDSLFNSVSLLTGTGYASAEYDEWGAFAVILLFMAGLIGGCAGSTCCSVKVFRYQILWSVMVAELKRVSRPHGVFAPRYAGKKLTADVTTSVTIFIFAFFVTLALTTLALAFIGLELETALSGAATALANVGPGFGDEIGADGHFGDLPTAAKVVLIIAMLLGRLELIGVLALLSPGFWRR